MRPALPLFLLVLALPSTAMASPQLGGWPRLDGGRGEPLCRQALELGRAAFRSAAASLDGVIDPPPSFPSAMIFRRVEAETFGGAGVSADEKVFTALTNQDAGAPTTLYWETEPRAGFRIAVKDSPAGWRGDSFSTYVLPGRVPLSALWPPNREGEAPKGAPRPLSDNDWDPPLVLRDRSTGADWIVHQSASYEVLGPWLILRPTSVDRPVCRVVFRPPFKSPTALLPPPVRKLAQALDEALGPGRDEGTLQPTARIRSAMSIAWTNVALRPWAVANTAYNSRAHVDAALEHWAQGAPRRRAVLTEIHSIYPAAEKALASFYRTTYGLSDREARSASRFALDAVYRGHFVFPAADVPDEKSDGAPKSAWPAGVR